MDLIQSEHCEQPTGKPVTSFVRDNQDSDFHESHQCYLEHLILKENFSCLANLLHTTIWHRFSLMPDEHLPADAASVNRAHKTSKQRLTESPSKNSHENSNPEATVFSSRSFHQLSTDLQCDKENMSSELPYEDEFHLLYETEKVNELTGWNIHPDSAACSVSPFPVLFSPWFVLSAVFTGCPKLLQYLVSLWEKYKEECCEISQGNNSVTEGILRDGVFHLSKTKGNCHSVSLYAQRSGILSKSVPTNLEADDWSATSDNKMKLNSHLQTLQHFVNAKIACEFPITDTWIHKSVGLIVSPLHLACWRHDFLSVKLLLKHGADPNELALEQISDELKNELTQADTVYSSAEHSNIFKVHRDLYFYRDMGLSPLHFVALGLRSPPRHSILEACKSGIMHDTCALYLKLKKSILPSCNAENLCGPMFMDLSNIDCVKLLPPGQESVEKRNERSLKCEVIADCLEMLLQAGANPNMGHNLILKGAYPLDILLQPPTKVYYAPSAARGNQSSVSLRLQDLEHNASQVVACCDTLLRYDAQLSSKFLSTYMWRPELLDCFHLNDSFNRTQLVTFLIRLGVFSDRFPQTRKQNAEERRNSTNVFISVIVHRFIADVMNTYISASLTYLILRWCPVRLLHVIIKTVAKIAEISGWNDRLRELSDMAVSLQLRSLKHGCFFVILSTVQHSFSKIWSLPLPTRLKRELTDLSV